MAERQGINLTVTGSGKVQVAPDEAVVHLSVVTEAKTAADAVAVNARQTQSVIAAVSAQPNCGVSTSGLSVYPIISYQPNTPPQIVGFRATNGVDVKTDVGDVGQIFDAGISAGANQSSGITFRIRDEAPYREEALRLAVDEALRVANVVADAADVEVKAVESLRVEPSEGRVFFRAAALEERAAATPILPEPQTITARVQVQLRGQEKFGAQPGAQRGKPANGVITSPSSPL